MATRNLPAATALSLGLLLFFSPLASAGLTTGDVDDNLNFQHFLDYADTVSHTTWDLPQLDLDDRITLRVSDADGAPVSWARVVYGNETVSATAFTGSDGVLRVFPSHVLGGPVDSLSVAVYVPGVQDPVYDGSLYLGSGARAFSVKVQEGTGPPTALDLMIVLDTTGSMDDEFQYLSAELEGIVAQVRASSPEVDMRFSLVVYRDHRDAYVVKSYPFTRSLTQMQDTLRNQSAYGGGDIPEAVEEAMEEALNQSWRAGNTAKLLWLVADAPPHSRGYDRLVDAFDDARAQGIRVYPVAGSGADPQAEYLFRLGALMTQGRYAFLTDDSGLGGSHAEPTVPCYQVTELSDLLGRVVEGELAGHRVEAAAESVMRTVGNYSMGVCLDGQSEQPETPETPEGPTIPAAVLPPSDSSGSEVVDPGAPSDTGSEDSGTPEVPLSYAEPPAPPDDGASGEGSPTGSDGGDGSEAAATITMSGGFAVDSDYDARVAGTDVVYAGTVETGTVGSPSDMRSSTLSMARDLPPADDEAAPASTAAAVPALAGTWLVLALLGVAAVLLVSRRIPPSLGRGS